MTDLRVLGVDPGPTPGLVLLDYTRWDDGSLERNRVEVLQCSAGLLEQILVELIRPPYAEVLVQVERFVVSGRAHRSSTPKAGQVTREMVTTVQQVCTQAGVKCYERRATDVKPWATANGDVRLAAAGLLEPTKGMQHARSAAWHALYCAVHDGGVPDPLSKRNK